MTNIILLMLQFGPGRRIRVLNLSLVRDLEVMNILRISEKCFVPDAVVSVTNIPRDLKPLYLTSGRLLILIEFHRLIISLHVLSDKIIQFQIIPSKLLNKEKDSNLR